MWAHLIVVEQSHKGTIWGSTVGFSGKDHFHARRSKESVAKHTRLLKRRVTFSV